MNGLAEDMWSPYKHLQKLIQQILANPTKSSVTDLELCLKKCKQIFSTILKNPPQNERNRMQLRTGITEGISIPGHMRTLVLSKDLVDEALIISDMFEVDELLALELLCTAQRQMPYHPGLPRGLVAILLYYDGRKAITYAMRDLFQVTSGVSWATDMPKEIIYLVSSFTQSLVDDYNILERIIDLLDELDIGKEIALLIKNRAIGTKKHHNQVLELFADIRLALATTLFNWSAQRGLPKATIVKLLQTLGKYKSSEANGTLDDITLTLLMTLLYAYDTSVLQRLEDSHLFLQSLPVMSEADFGQQVYNTLMSNRTAENKNPLDGIAKFAFGLSLANLRHTPQNIQNSITMIIERDEQLIDDAIAGNVFNFIYSYILDKEAVFKNEFFYRRMHMLLTDFIELMHSKVTELRGRADETARTVMSYTNEGLEPPPNLDNNFEMIMLCIGRLYKDNRAGLALCTEYWGPLDSSASYSKSTSRSVSLFKFIRLAGDLLPTTLFVSYLRMIAGLMSCEKSARSAFNLLKQSSGLSGSATLSWEHFFCSLMRYYSNLRKEQCPGSDTIYKHRVLSRSINPLEIEGLHAVLEVVSAVAKYDEVARIAMCEHPSWAPQQVLLGLLTCSVPLFLKAEILKTLSSLSMSKETAIQLWSNLEAAQIILTTPTTSSYITCSLEVDIEQNECRIETYPLSSAILDLLYTMMTTAVPKNLGGGPRVPGLDPYVNFIINSVFLKFYSRNYKDPAEKWAIGEKCLKVLHHLLNVYEVMPQDFDENRTENAPPGFHIMLQMHIKSDMLRLILAIVDEARTLFDEYTKFPGKRELEECARYCLLIVANSLAKQDLFFEAHSVASSSILLAGLNRMILDVNPRTKYPDHILNTTNFITYASWLPQHALVSVKILYHITKVPNAQVIGMFMESTQVLQEIRQGFVNCLENDLLVTATAASSSTEDSLDDSGLVTPGFMQQTKVELQIKEAIVELLHSCLPQPAPNVAHFLLGFDRSHLGPHRQAMAASIDATSNCLRSLVSLLDQHLEMVTTADWVVDVTVERIAERCYALLLSLCMSARTSDIVLRYLRSSGDFLYRHLSILPLKSGAHSSTLKQLSYLLKCTAIELKITASNSQFSRFQHLCELLIGSTAMGNDDTAILLEFNHYYSHSPSNLIADVAIKSPTCNKKITKMLLSHLLTQLEFEEYSQTEPKWHYFDNSLTEKMLGECEIRAEDDQKLINIQKLHEILNDELQTVQSSIAAGQRKLILQEIESVLLFALNVNDARKRTHATIKLVAAWGEVTEILFSCAPEASLPLVTKEELLLEIVQKVLSKIVPASPHLDLSILASEIVLILLVNLQRCRQQQQSVNGCTTALSDDVSAQADTMLRTTTTTEHSKKASTKSHSLSLKYILKNLTEWIIVSGVASQKLRINLYSSLLYCLQIIKPCDEMDLSGTAPNETYVTRLDKTMKCIANGADPNEMEEASQISAEIISSVGEKLIDIVCHDSIVSHDICKMVALSCIDVLLDIDNLSGFIHFIGNRGYLSHLIDSLLKSDESLCGLLHSTPDSLKSLYVYESKMAMLLRLANSHLGAEILLSHRVLSVLSNMRVFEMQPDVQGFLLQQRQAERGNDFIPPANERFRQLLLPALSLCDCIISTLGTENRSAVAQVLHFLLSHCDMTEVVLRTGTPFMDLGSLAVLAAVTGLIARITNQEIFDAEKQVNADIGVNLFRVQRFMLLLLNRFIINKATFKDMLKPEATHYDASSIENQALHVQYFLQIASNLALFCRNTIANHTADHRATCVLFAPKIAETQHGAADNQHSNLKASHSLGVVLSQLRGSVEYFNAQKSNLEILVRQRSALPNMSLGMTENCTYDELTVRYTEKQNELLLCAFITEQCLYLLWTHLDYFMRYSRSPNYSTKSDALDKTYALDMGYDFLLTGEDINILKKHLISTFNETFCKLLLSTTESLPEMDKRFNEVLLRRIQSLIQLS